MPMNVTIEPMTEDFILWRCLHWGPLTSDMIDRWPSDDPVPLERYRERNVPLLHKLTRIYGACAFVAHDGDRVVGQLRFYPKVVCDMAGAGGLCLLQDHPAGPDDRFNDAEFPAEKLIEDRTLVIHCLMTGSTRQKRNPYQRVGIGSRLVRSLISWAGMRKWEHIEVDAFEDLPVIYEITGSAGFKFWARLGFEMVLRERHPELRKRDWFVRILEEQARAAGIPPERARERLVMRRDLP